MSANLFLSAGSMVKAGLRMLAATSLVVVGMSAIAVAQTAVTGALTGTMTDPSGALIQNAKIEVTSEATGEMRSVASSASGHYLVSLLAPGVYDVQVTKAGFKRSDRAGVTITVTETATLDLGLAVGSVNESIVVSENEELAQTDSSALGRTVDAATVTSLPLVARNYTQILGLSPGVTMAVNNAGDLGKGTGRLTEWVGGSEGSQRRATVR